MQIAALKGNVMEIRVLVMCDLAEVVKITINAQLTYFDLSEVDSRLKDLREVKVR